MNRGRGEQGERIAAGLARLGHAALSAKAKASWQDPETRERRRAAMRAAWAQRETRARRRFAITRAMREHAAQIKCNNSPLFASALKELRVLAHGSRSRAPRPTDAAQLAAHACYEAALAAAAVALDLTLAQARTGNGSTAAGRARSLASYLAVFTFGIETRKLCAARKVDRRGLRRVLADVETRRADRAFDALVAALEQNLQVAHAA